MGTDGNNFNNWQTLHDHLKLLTNHTTDNNQFVTVDNYRPPALKEGNVGRAFYEAATDRFIYTNRHGSSEFLSTAILVKVEGDKAWFHQGANIWQVEITTGEVLRTYQPMLSIDKNSYANVWQENGKLWLTTTVPKNTGDQTRTTSYTYQVEETGLKLIAIDGDNDLIAGVELIGRHDELSSFKGFSDISKIFRQFGNSLPLFSKIKETNNSRQEISSLPPNTASSLMFRHPVPENIFLADVITATRQQNGVDKRYWLFTDAQFLQNAVRANLNSALPADLILAFVTTSDKPGYYFYSNKEHRLYFQSDDGFSGTLATTVTTHNIKSVFTANQQLVALTSEGTLWLLDNQGSATLSGVSADWLSEHRKNLTTQLAKLSSGEIDNSTKKYVNTSHENTAGWLLESNGATLAGVPAAWLNQHSKDLTGQLGQSTSPAPNRFANLVLSGVKDSEGKPVHAWYDSTVRQLVQGGANLDANHTLTYLGLTDDNNHAWIFDIDSQLLYRQPLSADYDITLDEQLVITSKRPRDAEQHTDQKYISALRVGNKLRLETVSGAILLLPLTAKLTDKPALIAFHVKTGTPAETLDAIQAATGIYEAPPVIRLLSEPDHAPAWYLTGERKIIRAKALDSKHFLNYLGKIAGQDGSYIHDQTTGALWSISDTQSTIMGNYRFVHNEQGNLVLQVSEDAPIGERVLPQLQGASHLILSNRIAGQQRYVIGRSLRGHYKQVLIDDRSKNAVIQLDHSDKVIFSLQLSGQDLILHDKASDTSILVADIERTAQRGMALEIADAPPLALSKLLAELKVNTTGSKLVAGNGQLQIELALQGSTENDLTGTKQDDFLYGRLNHPARHIQSITLDNDTVQINLQDDNKNVIIARLENIYFSDKGGQKKWLTQPYYGLTTNDGVVIKLPELLVQNENGQWPPLQTTNAYHINGALSGPVVIDTHRDTNSSASLALKPDTLILPWAFDEIEVSTSNNGNDMAISHKSRSEYHPTVHLLNFIQDEAIQHLTIIDTEGKSASFKLGENQVLYLSLGDITAANDTITVYPIALKDTTYISGYSIGLGINTQAGDDTVTILPHKVITNWNGYTTLRGGKGKDRFFSGNGNETYIFAPGDNQDTITDLRGDDKLYFEYISKEQLTFQKRGNDLIIGIENTDDSVAVKNAFLDPIYQIESIETSENVLDMQSIIYAMHSFNSSDTTAPLPENLSLPTSKVLPLWHSPEIALS